MIENIRKELAIAWRILRRRATVTAGVVAILAIGIAVAAAAFSGLQAGLLNDLPYRDQDRLVLLHGTAVRTDTVQEWETLSHSYEQLTFVAVGTADVPLGAAMLEASTALVSNRFFSMLGVNIAVGRMFSEADFRENGPPVAILSNFFADKHFGSSGNAIGKLVMLDGIARQVVGVLHAPNAPLPYKVDVWLPLVKTRPQYADGIAILRQGSSPASAQSEAATIAKHLPLGGRPATVTVAGLKETIVKDSRQTLILVMAATILLLVIICSNAASLILVQIASREREFAMRAALGATRGLLFRQLFGETLLTTLCATAAAVPLSFWLIHGAKSIFPATIPRLSEVGFTGSVMALIFLAGVSAAVLISCVLFAVARHFASLSALTERLHARRLSLRRGVFSVLVAAEVALTTMLLVGTGLLVESFIKLAPYKPGFEYSDKLVLRIIMPDAGPGALSSRLQSVIEDVGRYPGVSGVTATSELPLTDTSWVPNVWMDGNLIAGRRSSTFVHCRASRGNFFRLMSIPILEGRSFSEVPAREQYAVVNQAFVQRLGRGKQLLGKGVTIDIDGKREDFVIIGVTQNIRMFSSTTIAEPELYIPIDRLALKRVSLVAQVHDTSEAEILSLRSLVEKNSGANSVLVARPLEQILADGIQTPRTRAIMFGGIAVIAVLLAAAGIYGILSWSIEVGSREIGIRTALGAQPRRIVAFVLKQTIFVTLAGTLAGMSGAILAGHAMVSLLYNTKPTDLTSIVAAGLITVTISALASAIPARRATRIDPLVVMRSE